MSTYIFQKKHNFLVMINTKKKLYYLNDQKISPPKSKFFSLKKVRGGLIFRNFWFFSKTSISERLSGRKKPKIFFGKFRTFSKDPHKIFAKFWFWVVLSGSLKMPVLQKMTFSGSWNRQKSWESHFSQKNRFFQKSKILIPQSNHGKRNIEVMLVRP